MTAAAYDLKIEQGEDWTPQWILRWPSGNPRDITGWGARLQVRSVYYATAIMVELTIENGGITLGGTAGTIQFNMTSTQTMSFFSGPSPNPVWQKINGRPYTKVGQYDLRLYDTNAKNICVVGGNVLVSPCVSRPS